MSQKTVSQVEKELFDMVYQWGRVGVVVDHNAPAYKDKIKELVSAAVEHVAEGKE